MSASGAGSRRSGGRPRGSRARNAQRAGEGAFHATGHIPLDGASVAWHPFKHARTCLEGLGQPPGPSAFQATGEGLAPGRPGAGPSAYRAAGNTAASPDKENNNGVTTMCGTTRKVRNVAQPSDRALKTAERLFAQVSRDLARQMKGLDAAIEAGDAECPRAVEDLAVRTQKALQSVLDLELRLMKAREKAAPAAGAELDLEAARDEIESRLARLEAA